MSGDLQREDSEASESLPLIYRQVSFTVPAFDRLKGWQRHWQRTEDRPLTNSEALDRLILATPRP